MKNKKMILPAVAVLVCAALMALIFILWKIQEEEAAFSEKYVMAQELPALLSFTYYDAAEWETELQGIVSGKVSYGELSQVLKLLGIGEYVTYEKKAGFVSVPRAVFFDVYGQVLDLLDPEKRVTSQNLIFLSDEAKEGQWLTQQGYLTLAGGSSYVSRYSMYRAFMLDGAALGLERQLIDEPLIWENVFVHKTEEGTAQVLYEKALLSVDIAEFTGNIIDTVCDIEFQNNAVSAIYKKEETISGTVLSYNEKQIEIEGYGTLEHSGNLRIYKTYGTVEQLDESKLIIGNLMADFVVARGKVCGIILKKPAQIEQIRVLVLNEGSPFYPELYVTSTEEFTADFAGTQQTLPGGTLVKASDYFASGAEGYLRLDSAVKEGSLFLANEKGELVSQGYPGGMEIRRFEEGYSIVNQLSLEDYLCGVVPSEMPASYEMEALRAQAVCARSYACIQLTQGEYARFAANVDDSTNYQVYNKQPRDERSTLAVQDTVGEVISMNGELAEAYYYSTSCGFSQNMDVWNLDPESFGYLKSVSLLTDESTPDISTEEAFLAFITNRDYVAYDSDGAYFRWRAEIKPAERLSAIQEAALNRQAANPDNVQCFDAKGAAQSLDFAVLGNITNLIPEERSAGGVLKRLRIQCEQGSILATTEYNIRKILKAAATAMTDKNEKAIDAMDLLPSAAFSVTPVEGGFVLYGGGYGHGIGLSQNGANGMAKAGFTYTDILLKFYQNITIENIYNSPKDIQ